MESDKNEISIDHWDIPKDKFIICQPEESISHCHLRRNDLRNAIRLKNLTKRVFIPADGETIKFED